MRTDGPGQSKALREAQLMATRRRNQAQGAAAALGPAGAPRGRGLEGARPAPVSGTHLAPERGLQEVTAASNLPGPGDSHAVGKVRGASRGAEGTAAPRCAAPSAAPSPVPGRRRARGTASHECCCPARPHARSHTREAAGGGPEGAQDTRPRPDSSIAPRPAHATCRCHSWRHSRPGPARPGHPRKDGRADTRTEQPCPHRRPRAP